MRAKHNLALILATISTSLISAFVVSGILSTSRTVETSGTVKAINVDIYWDVNCTQVVSDVDWGFCEPDSTVDKIVHIKNNGNAPMTLNMSCSGWSPEGVDDYISLSWDRQGSIIAADEVVPAVLTLSILDTITDITDFSFNIVIEGTG